MKKTCNKDCVTRLKEHGEATGRLADLLGHDAVGHRTMASLLPAGLLDLDAVAAVDPDVIAALPFIGAVRVDRVYDAVVTEYGFWQRHWNIRRIAEVFGDHAWRFQHSVENAVPAEVPAVIEAWLPLAEKVWAKELAVGSPEWNAASYALIDPLPTMTP